MDGLRFGMCVCSGVGCWVGYVGLIVVLCVMFGGYCVLCLVV